MTLLDHALTYAQRGALVFPLNADKTPATDNGFYDATKDAKQITEWWTRNPNHLIGCRVPDGVVVLDIDPRHNGDKVWSALETSYHPIELGRQHHSGRDDGGFHAWFRHPGGKLSTKALTEWADREGVAGRTDGGKPTCGIDVLHHENRYTILPPSPHALTGKPYTWDNEGKPAIMPPWLASLLEPPTPAPPPPRQRLDHDGDDSIADWYSDTARWADILTGWTVVHSDGESDGSKWRHPTATASWSATIRHGCLFVYSTNTDYKDTEASDPNGYTKFKAYATSHHGGDMSAAGRSLRERKNADESRPASKPTASKPESNDDSQTEPWPEPLPLHEHERPPFPLEVLPDWMADQVNQAAVEMQLTPDLAAQLAITAMSVICAGRVMVRIRGPWKEPTNTYLVTAMPPSAGKSPTFGMMLGALDHWEEELSEDGLKIAEDRELDRRHLEKLRDDALKKGEVSQAKAYGDDLRDLPLIHPPRLLADDATPEKLVELLHQQNGRLALVSTEGGLFGMMTGRYSDRANLDVYLDGWSGDVIRVDRVERGSIVVRRPRLTIGLTVQPSVIADVGKNRELVGRGLTTRFMYVVPADTVGTRSKSRDSTYSQAVADRYDKELLAIAGRLPEIGADETLLAMSPAATRTFTAWQDEREAKLGPFGPLRYMAEWISKCDSTTARLAALLHVADGSQSSTVDEDTVKRAIVVGNYWTAHARAAFDLMGASDDIGHARYILGWLQSRQNDTTMTFRDIHQSGAKRRVESPTELAPAVEMLVDHGWLRPLFDGALVVQIGRGKSSPAFSLHPSLSCPHLSRMSHIPSETENEAPLSENVRTVSDVSLNAPEDHIHTSFECEGVDDTKRVSLSSHPDSDPDDLDQF